MSTMFREFGAGLTAFEAPLDARLAFIRRTYLHVTGAVAAFAFLSWAVLPTGLGERIYEFAATTRWGWPLVLVGFLVSGYVARAMAHGSRSAGVQYAGLAFEVGAWTVIFSPLIWLAARAGGGVLPTAAGLTVLAFGGLSAYVLTTKKDLSFLRPFLVVAGLVALGLIFASSFFAFELGMWFSAAMILFAIGAILYKTSEVVHSYRTDQHVAASLELFASVALLFWYVVSLLLQSQRR